MQTIKKTNMLLMSLMTFLIINTGCSKDSSCGFEKNTFVGKWKISKIMLNGTDVTSQMFSVEPCTSTMIIELKSDGTSTETNTVSTCTSGNNGTWSLSSSGGKNMLITGTDTTTVKSYSCSSVTIMQDNAMELTITKQ